MSTAPKTARPKKATAKVSKTGPKKTSPVAAAATAAKEPDGRAAEAPINPGSGAVATAKSVTPTVVDAPEAVMVGPAMRKKEIIEEVVLRTGMKKRDVKPVIESMLSVLGEGLGQSRELVIPPLGRVKIHKQKTTPKKRILFAKVHQNIPQDAKDEPPASGPLEAAE